MNTNVKWQNGPPFPSTLQMPIGANDIWPLQDQSDENLGWVFSAWEVWGKEQGGGAQAASQHNGWSELSIHPATEQVSGRGVAKATVNTEF